MKNFQTIILLLLANICSAQTEVTDDFNDDEFDLWTGDNAHFIINASHQLQLNNNVAGSSYLATSFAPTQTNLEWNVYVRQAFAGSANNYGRIYLLSSQQNLTQPTEGYFLQLGEAGSNDAVELFRQTGTVTTSVCRAPNATIAGTFAIRIKVTRDDEGVWTLFIDYSAGTDFVEVATGIDLTYVTGQWMGFVCVYTAGNASRFFFDDVFAGAPKPPPPPADIAEPFDVVINEFFPDPTPSVGLPEEEFVELYNRSTKTFRLNGWKLGDLTSLQALPDVWMKPNEYVVVKNSISLNNSGDVIKIIDDHGMLIDSLRYTLEWYHDNTKTSGGYTIERLDPEASSTDPTNWYVSQSEVGGTPGAVNSVFGRNPDSTPPEIKNIAILNDSTLIVTVSENVVIDGDNYELDAVIRTIEFNPEDSTVVIKVVPLTNGLNYTLTITGLADSAGNVATDKSFPFTYFVPHPVQQADIVINEIMFDPTPVVQLPDAEYVELFNRSIHPINLSGWRLADPSTSALLPSLILMPQGYLLLTSVTNASKLAGAVGIPSFPSLGNSGDIIVLRSPDGLVIDSLSYQLSWYQDQTKSDGGYALERLNPDVASAESTNWYVSQDSSGGTPGRINSVFGRNPDSKPPVIKGIVLKNDSTLAIKVSEEVQINKNNYHPESIVRAAVFNPSDTTLLLYLDNLTNGNDYTLKIAGLTDLAGNIAADKEFTFTYFIAHPVHPKDIIITEIMADPTPVVQLPEAEFIELFNRSPNPINLNGWHLEDLTTTAPLPSMILMPNTYALLTSTANASKFTNAIGVRSFPSLGNLSDQIVLRNANGVAIDSVVYNLSWYHSAEKSDGGWSLELIDIHNPCGEDGNWTASEDIDGGTPGEVNSVFANKPDLTPPELISLFAPSPDTLLISFNEKLGATAGSYSLPGTARIQNRQITYLLDEPLSPRVEYSLTINGVTDCNGNVIEPTTINFSLPETAGRNDVVINEVLFNPRPTGVDFIEIYNRSAKYLNLKDWAVSGQVITTANTIFKPATYLVLTPSIAATQSDYIQSIGKPMLETRLPSMPDDEGTVRLTDAWGITIDQFSYNSGMHSPILSDPEGVSLERISFEDSTWHSASESAGFATPGYLNSSSRLSAVLESGMVDVNPEVVKPLSFSQISYRFDQAGLVANVFIVDIDGRVIKTVASNETLGSEGSFQWDGDRDAGGRARAGYYLLWFQTFDLEGKVRTYRRRVVIGF